jgi:hypothetical protein
VVNLLTDAGFAGARAVLNIPGTTQQVIVGQQPA